MRTFTTALLLAILCLGAAKARTLQEANAIAISAPPSTEESQVSILSVSQANALADTLIASLENPNAQEVSIQDSQAATILSTAVNGNGGPEATAIILTKLSDYILQNGCTAPVKAQLKNLLESDYQGNTFAMVGALRALDVRTTPCCCFRRVSSGNCFGGGSSFSQS